MGNAGQIVVTPANIDDVIARLRLIGTRADEIARTEYSLGVTAGAGGEALVRAGKATNASAQAFADTIMGLAGAIDAAKKEFQDVDFELAAQMAGTAGIQEDAANSAGEIVANSTANEAGQGGGSTSW